MSSACERPWSLSSEQSWNKSNRLAGRLFFWLGAATIVAVLAHVPGLPLLVGFLSCTGLMAIVVLAYSYVVWRQDEHKSAIGRG